MAEYDQKVITRGSRFKQRVSVYLTFFVSVVRVGVVQVTFRSFTCELVRVGAV